MKSKAVQTPSHGFTRSQELKEYLNVTVKDRMEFFSCSVSNGYNYIDRNLEASSQLSVSEKHCTKYHYVVVSQHVGAET